MVKLCQVDLGITVVGDGEMSKPSYVSYVSQRLTGWVFHEFVEQDGSGVNLLLYYVSQKLIYMVLYVAHKMNDCGSG